MAEAPGQRVVGYALRYPYELRDEDDCFDDIPAPRLAKDMVDVAAHILDTKASKFDPHKFKDKYETALKALVKRKAAGKTIDVPEEKQEESNVIDLMDALKQSLATRKLRHHPRREGRPRSFRSDGGAGALGRRYPGWPGLAVRDQMGWPSLPPVAG